jgi:hypothetical protein
VTVRRQAGRRAQAVTEAGRGSDEKFDAGTGAKFTSRCLLVTTTS